MLNIIQIWPLVSEKMIFKVFYIDYIREFAPPPGGHVFLDIIMNFRDLQEGHIRTIPAKYQYNLASSFREEDFYSFLYTRHILLRELAPPPGGHVF